MLEEMLLSYKTMGVTGKFLPRHSHRICFGSTIEEKEGINSKDGKLPYILTLEIGPLYIRLDG